MSNHPCGVCGTLHFNSPCPVRKALVPHGAMPEQKHMRPETAWEIPESVHDHDNYAIIICDPKRGNTARDCEGFTRATNEAHEVMRGFHDEVVVKQHHNPLGKLKSFAFYYSKGVLVGVIAPSKKVGT